MSEGPLTTITDMERQALTVWGATFSAQMRDTVLVIRHYDSAPRSDESGRPWALPVEDAVKLRELLNEAAEREALARTLTGDNNE